APVFREFMAEAMETRQPGEFRPPREAEMVTVKFDSRTGERLPSDAEGPFVVARTYSLGVEPEILVEDTLALADDAVLFGGYGSDLPYILPEGEDVPLGSGDWSDGGGDTSSVSRPPSIGLGTGGLY